jgi:hypothetical protein
MNLINKIYPDFKWESYRDLNPYLQIIGLKTEDEYTNNFILEGRYKGRIYKQEQNKKYSFHILLATIGKISILKMLEFLKNQLTEIDFLTIVFDGSNKSKNIDIITKYCSEISFKCKVNIIIEEKNLGYWGHGIRNKHNDLEGDFIYHIDDDDIIYDNTFNIIRKHCTDINMIYIFKIILENNKIIWETPVIKLNYISTQSGVIPKELNKKGYWELKYGGDYNFYKSICNDNNTIFIDKVIYKKI